MGAMSTPIVIPDLDPSEFAHQTRAMARYFAELAAVEKNKVLSGGIVSDPSTPSAQLTGVGNTTWSYDSTLLDILVDGVQGAIAAATDGVIHSGSFLTGLVNGTSCVAAIVIKNAAGILSLVAVKGTPATTGTQRGPTDSEIDTAVSDVPWVKIAECTLNRTGDTTVTESQDNTVRPVLGVSVDPNFGVFTG